MFKPSLSCRLFLCAIITLPALLTPMASGQTMLSAVSRFVADDGIAGNAFARSIDFDGTLAVVGAYFDDVVATNSGSAYVFDVETGEQLYQLVAFDGQVNDWFGKAVAISGNLVAIGAEQANEKGVAEDGGAVYVYDTDTGDLIQKIIPDDNLTRNRFGYALCFTDQYLIVSAFSDDNIAINAGSVYVYDRVTLELVTKLVGDDTAVGDNFGTSIAAHGQTLAVGSVGVDENGPDSGAVYVFDLQTMTQTQKLVPADIDAGDLAGQSVAVYDGVVAVGVPVSDFNGRDSGAVYFFDAATGSQIHKLVSTDISADDRFGESISIWNDTVVIGARKYDFGDSPYGEANAGTAYLFDVQSGGQLARLVPGEIEDSAGDFFGGAVSIQGSTIVVGAQRDNEHSNPAGAVHVFSIEGLRFADDSYFPSEIDFPDRFGHSVAIDGSLIAVGAPFDQESGDSRSGAGYVFDVSTGEQVQKIFFADGGFNVQFGRSIAIDDGVVVIGAPLDMHSGQIKAGSATLYDARTGETLVELNALDAEAVDLFGHSAAMDNGIVVVGAYAEDDNGGSAGAAYTFDASTGVQLAKLLADDGRQNDQFGWSVAIEDGIAVVGSPFSDPGPVNTGAVYVFDAATGEQLLKIVAEDRWASDLFGQSVAIRNGVVAVGAPGDDSVDPQAFDSGSVYLFDAMSGEQIGKVFASDPTGAARFGWSVAMNSTQLVVGLRRSEFIDAGLGKAYLFDLATFEQAAALLPTDGTPGDRFGTAVAASDETVVVGASNELEGSNDSGTVYAFASGLVGCDVDIDGNGTLNFFDISAFIELLGGREPGGDFNGDGRYNYFDISAFLGAYSDGCS